jgi:hypothetical protein
VEDDERNVFRLPYKIVYVYQELASRLIVASNNVSSSKIVVSNVHHEIVLFGHFIFSFD